jgi:hypothetical protein
MAVLEEAAAQLGVTRREDADVLGPDRKG